MYEKILTFWFDEISTEQWWIKDPEFDQLIRSRFASVHAQSIKGELYDWRYTAQGRLAEILVLDQFSRNIYRDQAQAFAADSAALVLAQEAVSLGADQTIEQDRRGFLYMPYMHSESKLIHEVAINLFVTLGIESYVQFEQKHKVIIDRFGRYPHRNDILGRVSTPQELSFLSQPGSSF
ncbi:MAG: DUF924 domain-containing protein [Myxococcales bacterium]|nr:DUF924 domain-containing protein [Myxococcales bacterium]